MCRERKSNTLLLEAAGNGFAVASERTAAGPSVGLREEHKVAVRRADTHSGPPVIEGLGVLGSLVADEPAAGRAGA